MKNQYIYILFALVLFGTIQSCDEPPIELPFNDHLLFHNSYELDLSNTVDSNNFPIFDISKIDYEQIFIAISTQPLTTANNEVENQDDIIWQWHSGMELTSKIGYIDGALLQPDLDFNGGLCCDGDKYYWSAWAWNESGEYIIASTGNTDFNVTIKTPQIRLDSVVLHYESGGDGFAQKEEDITLRIFIKNTSDVLATDVKGTFTHPLIAALPQTLTYGNLAPNQSKFVELDFKVPIVSNDNLNLDIDAKFTYNETLSYDTIATQYVALLPCVDNVIIDWSYRDFATIDNSGNGADLFFKVYTNGNYWDRGVVIDNLFQSDLPQFWFYNSCEMYDLVTLFTFEFLDQDYNPLAPPTDYLGSISFTLGEFAVLNNYPEYLVFENNEIKMRLQVTWI